MNIIEDAINYTKEIFQDEFSGHDFAHTYRVYQLATTLAKKENANVEVVQLASLLHDVDDFKLSPATYPTKQNARDFLNQYEVDVELIIQIISEVSFLGDDSITPTTIESMCVQDADRLDAIGAIGIARCFTYGGHKSRVLYNPAIPPTLHMNQEQYQNHVSTTINHFYEKLLLLKDLMNTKSAKQMANHRHQIMVDYLQEFFDEWEGIR